jgi:nucleoside-diphosphate-sugar epimerase
MLRKKKVLLTGASGTLGDNAIKPLLKSGFDIFAITYDNTRKDKKNIHWINTDLSTFNNIRTVFKDVRPEYLLHLDWFMEPSGRFANDLNLCWFQSGLEMLKQFKTFGGKRAVYCGTCFEYEFDNEPLNEFNSKINPKSSYAKYKNYLNEIASVYAKDNDLSFGWGRIFNIYGFDELPQALASEIIEALLNDKEIRVSASNLVRDYMFPCEIGNAFVKFLCSNVEGNVNICTNTPVKVKETLSLIPEKLKKENLLKFEDINIDNEPEIILGDNTRLLNVIGFKPERTSINELDKLIIKAKRKKDNLLD